MKAKAAKKKRVPWRKWSVPPGQKPLSVTPAERKIVELMEVARLSGNAELVGRIQKQLAARLQKRLDRRLPKA